jgi:hypothetical protein
MDAVTIDMFGKCLRRSLVVSRRTGSGGGRRFTQNPREMGEQCSEPADLQVPRN